MKWPTGVRSQILAVAILGMATSFAQAAEVSTLLPQPDGRVVDERASPDQDRAYPLGSIRRIGGQTRMEGKVEARGTLSSITYELPSDRSAAELFKSARQALVQPASQLLFWCQGRDCGESNLWANEVFKNTRLLGSDDQQAFVLVREADDNLVAVYCVIRGNRRVALHVEQFVPDAPLGDLLPTASTLLRELRDSQHLDFPSLAAPSQPEWVTLLSRTLNMDITLRVSLSGQNVADWRMALIDQGVRASRLEAGAENAASKGLHLELIR